MLWYGTSGDGSSHSRSKVGQNSLLILEIVYKENNKKVYGVERLIKLSPKDGKKGEQLRSMDDFDFDFTKLIEIAKSDKIEKINYYTEIEGLDSKLWTEIDSDEQLIVNELLKNKFHLIIFEEPKKYATT